MVLTIIGYALIVYISSVLGMALFLSFIKPETNPQTKGAIEINFGGDVNAYKKHCIHTPVLNTWYLILAIIGLLAGVVVGVYYGIKGLIKKK